MQQEQFKSSEHWATDVFGDTLTNGLLKAYKNVLQLIIKLNAATILAFFRYRTGTRFISGGTIVWGNILMSLLWLMETTSNSGGIFSNSIPEEKSSAFLFSFMMTAFTVVGCYRRYESRKNLRRIDGKEEPRYGADAGLSYLWPVFKKVFSPMGLISTENNDPIWWKINEYKFQKIIEPGLIIFIGFLLKVAGYGGFGLYLIVAGASAIVMVIQVEDTYYSLKQEKWDAKVLTMVIQNQDEPIKRMQGSIVQQAIIRKNKDFDKWKKNAQPSIYFEKVAGL